MKAVRSVLKLGAILSRYAARGAVYAVGGNVALALDQLRAMAIIVHDDCLSIVVWLQRRAGFSRPPAVIRRVLIVKLDRIGDMVNTTPMIDALRTWLPGVPIDLVGDPGSLSLLDGDDRIAARIPYRSSLYHPVALVPPGPTALRLLIRLMRQRYDLVVYVRGSLPFLALAWAAPFAATKYVNSEPTVRRYLKPLEALFGPAGQVRPRLHTSPERRLRARNVLRPAGSRRALVAIHATAATDVKQWPAERFTAIADMLNEELNADVHFFGSAADAEKLEGIAKQARHPHGVQTGWPLPDVVAAIAECDLFIGNDSGLGHVAAALDVPIVLVWGPANIHEARPVAPPERCEVLYHDLPCRVSCPEICCTNTVYQECLLEIEPAHVLAAARRVLHATERLPVLTL